MQNSIKKQLYEILKTMNEAHENIIRSLKKNGISGIAHTLGECQNTAIQIGQLIDKLEGTGTQTVSVLNKYCEQVSQISQNLETSLDYDNVDITLREHILMIENSVRNDLPTKYEVVFLPYKAAMWDSLESIWKAANDDNEVDAYVVPIPYYDINPDHTFGQMHYEGSLYPSYVQISSWEKYNIKERRPDAIFIHNPYDSSNFVTSIHPNFYSTNLKKYTDMLVYVPYFVALDDVEKHFCVLPAIIFANRVILQSEKIRNTYIKYFGEWVNENNYEKIFPQYKDKFLALGSPKIEKVMTTSKTDCTIPEEWKKLMKNEEGKNRKIVLYNTTIQALLNGNTKVLDKIESVLRLFKDNKEILLLWRPHPLNIATYAAMRPNLLKRYELIVDRYKSEGWGIYDDTSDMNRAIALSDAYYGDWSSLVALYKTTGKPIMIQNTKI